MASTSNDFQKVAKIEEVLEFTGFGLYSIGLMFCVLVIETGKQSSIRALTYVLPYIACDFPINSVIQGGLNGANLLGSALFTPIWGTICDIYGRRKIMRIMTFIASIIAIIITFAPDSTTMLIMSLLVGICTANLSAIPIAFLCEFHSLKYGPFMTLYVGFGILMGTLLLPILAMGIIPLTFKYLIGTLVFNSWRLYLIVGMIVPIFLSFISLLLVHETPKYLLSNGQEEKALEVLKTIYKWNKRKKIEPFPFQQLENDTDIEIEKINKNWNNCQTAIYKLKRIRELFKRPYLTRFLVLVMLYGMNGFSTSVTFWLPQFFAMQSDYIELYNGTESATMCDIIQVMQLRNTTGESTSCSDLHISLDRFIQSIMVGGFSIVARVIIMILVNYIDKKYILTFVQLSMGVLMLLTLFVTGSSVPLLLYDSVNAVETSLVFIFAVQTFPTAIRVLSVSTSFVSLQLSIALTNLFFPSWLIYSCQQPFIVIGVINIGISVFVLFFIDQFLPVIKETKEEPE